MLVRSDSWNASFRLEHNRDLLNKLKQVNAMLWVAVDDFLSSNVREVIFQNLLTKQVDERLNILSHLIYILTSSKLTKVDLWECSLKELNVKLVAVTFYIKV